MSPSRSLPPGLHSGNPALVLHQRRIEPVIAVIAAGFVAFALSMPGIVLLSFWESVAAIIAFAGDDYERARYYPEDDAFLLEREPHVRHFEVVGDPAT